MKLVDLAPQRARMEPGLSRAIARVLDHGQFIMGPEVAELEARLAQFCGARHCITTSSGTDALLLAMLAQGIGAGDGVICPAFGFVAAAEVARLIGAVPIFAEVSDIDCNLDPARLPEAVEAAHRANITPRAIVAIDTFGVPAPLDEIEAFVQKQGLNLISDAAQSFGAARDGRRVSLPLEY